MAICATVLSCTKANNNISADKKVWTLSADIEQPTSVTKADLNSDLQTLWKTGDVIKVYIENGANDWSTADDFTLSSGNGNMSGTFHCSTEYSETDHWDRFAYFPYYYKSSPEGDTGNTGSEVDGDKKMKFNLPQGYYCYESGQSYLPLLANLGTSGVKHPASASFKFVGGAVVLNLTKVPGAAKSVGLYVDGKDITGQLGLIEQANVGNASGILTAGGTGTNNNVWLNFDSTGSEDRSFKFIFPVPTISGEPDLTFKMYDKNNLLIWQKTASDQSAIGRAQALVMPAKEVTPIPQNMYLVGYWSGADDKTGIAFDNTTGTCSLTHTGDGYVCLRAADTGNWYMTDAYVGSGTTATVKCKSGEKLYVPEGTHTYTMAYQSDGSIVLSYE